MPSLRPQDLHTCTVKLSIDGIHGTGFLVATGLILTCHHVVKNAGDRLIKVRWQNQENFAVAKVWQSFPDPVDLALLQFEAVEPLVCVELDGAIAAFDDLFAYGYPDNDSNGAPVTFRCDGFNGDVPPKIKFSDNRVRPGLSGAPLLNPATGKVCGVVKYTEDRSLPLGGGGIPIKTVLEYFPVLNTPYKGLAYFKDDDARFFFGRTALTNLLLDRLQQSNFLALLGASGSGKSSVLRAGLLNQLRQGRLSGSDRWELRVMLPTEHPLKSLANEFVDQKLGNIDRAAQLATAEKLLTEGKDGLRRLVEATAKTTRMVLVIDQFEESFTLCQNLEEREQFFACLIGALEITTDKFCLAIAMRADFFGKCVEREYGGLSKRIAAHLVAVTPMNDDELREAIAKPTEIVGCEVEPILIEEIVRDVAGAPANLPLMQFALSELWRLRDGNRLTLQAYKQELGGITGALEKRANAVYAQFTDELDKRAVKHIFLSLTQLGEGTEDTRRRVVMSNLVTATLSLEAIERVVRKLADEKLVVTDDREKGKVSGEAIVDVAHEALIRGWRLLRGWLDEDRQNLHQQRWIEDRAIEWQGSGKVKEFLLSGRQLKEAQKFQQQQMNRFPLSELAEQLLKVSKWQQRKGWALAAAIYMAIPISVAIVLNYYVPRWFYLETKWAILRQCEKEQNEDGNCMGRIEALRVLIDANVNLQGINLSRANLIGANFDGIDLSGSNLTQVNLTQAKLRKSNLSRITLKKANVKRANFDEADLERADLNEANFQGSILRNANLSGANLLGANFSEANLRETNLSNTDLRMTNINESDIRGTNFSYADLRGINLSNRELIESNLSRANLLGTNLSKADLTEANLSNMDLRKTNINEAKLLGANLSNSDIREVNLSNRKLIRINLSGANLIDVNLSQSELMDARLNKAKLSQSNLSQTDLRGAEIFGSDLTRSQLREANLQGANLENAILNEANLSGANLSEDPQFWIRNPPNDRRRSLSKDTSRRSNLYRSDFRRANLKGANLGGANISETDFYGADLSEANFTEAIISYETRKGERYIRRTSFSHANLSRSNLSKFNIGEADISSANLSEADLTNLINPSPQQIKTACNWEKAKMSRELRVQIEKASNPMQQPDCSIWNNLP